MSKHEYGGRCELHGAREVKTHSPPTQMWAHSGATEIGSQQTELAPIQTIYTQKRIVKTPLIHVYTHRHTHSQTTDTHWDPTGPGCADGETEAWSQPPPLAIPLQAL